MILLKLRGLKDSNLLTLALLSSDRYLLLVAVWGRREVVFVLDDKRAASYTGCGRWCW
jgi:hypothetical protein